MGCLLWVQALIDIRPQFLLLCIQYLVILYRVITAMHCIWHCNMGRQETSVLLPGKNNHLLNKTWDENTYPFPNFKDHTVDAWGRINNFIRHFIMEELNDPTQLLRIMRTKLLCNIYKAVLLNYQLYVTSRRSICFYSSRLLIDTGKINMCVTVMWCYFPQLCLALLHEDAYMNGHSYKLYALNNSWLACRRIDPMIFARVHWKHS